MNSKIIILSALTLISFKSMAEDSLGGTLSYKDKSGSTGSVRVTCSKRKKDTSCARYNINGTAESINQNFLKYKCDEALELNEKKVFFQDDKRQKSRLDFSQSLYKVELQSKYDACNLSVMNKLEEKYGKDSIAKYLGLPVDLVKSPVCLAINHKVFGSDKVIKKDFNILFDEASVGKEVEISRSEWSSIVCGLTLK
jgi:hypothetical protein